MTWLASAEELLAVANTAALTTPVARSFVAPGSSFARDCRLLAVHLDSIDTAPLPGSDLPGGSCAFVPALNLVVTFLADCYPAANDQGVPPPVADVTAWTEDFLTDVEAIWGAVADAALDGTLGECSGVSISSALLEGPQGGAAQFTLPIRLLSL